MQSKVWQKRLGRKGFNLGVAISCALGMLQFPVHADDNGVLTDKKSLLQAPVADVRIAELKAAVVSGDAVKTAQFFHFPLNVMTKTADGQLKLEQIGSVAEFVQQYPQLLSPMQQQFLRCLTPMQLSFDGFDYSALAGQFWLRDFSYAGKRDFYISTISQDPAVLAPWLSANCQDVALPVNDELGVIEASAPAVVAAESPTVSLVATSTRTPAQGSLPSFVGQSEQHRIEVSEVSAGKWRYRSWLLAQTDEKPALEIVGAKVLDGKGPILQFRRGKYRYRFIMSKDEQAVGQQPVEAAARIEIYYNEKLLRTELIRMQ